MAVGWLNGDTVVRPSQRICQGDAPPTTVGKVGGFSQQV
jgi:hypothetical protein